MKESDTMKSDTTAQDTMTPNIMKSDIMTKELLNKILTEGELDENPRPHYSDGTPAHTLSINHVMQSYDLTKNELPLTTLRPLSIKKSIGEMLWIYQDQSNDLDLLADKYNVHWWNEWSLKDKTGENNIGAVYGYTVKKHDLINKLLNGLIADPDGRRHIMNLWQEDDFKKPHGLKPCAFQTTWNVRHHKDSNGKTTDYLDMCLFQRSSDYCTAGHINQIQYVVLQHLVARHVGMVPGKFTWFVSNIQIYDRHIEQAKEMLKRTPLSIEPHIWLNPEKTNFYDFTLDDIKIKGYSYKEINNANPQLHFDIGI